MIPAGRNKFLEVRSVARFKQPFQDTGDLATIGVRQAQDGFQADIWPPDSDCGPGDPAEPAFAILFRCCPLPYYLDCSFKRRLCDRPLIDPKTARCNFARQI